MNLYRIEIIIGQDTIQRGVWADGVEKMGDHFYFFNVDEYGSKTDVGFYPADLTMIHSIQTKEAYEKSKEAQKEKAYESIGKKW